MSKHSKIKWLKEPQKKNYGSARSYLSLIYDTDKTKSLVDCLRACPMSQFKAKDVLRATGMSLVGVTDAVVKKNHLKIRAGIALSPILLVRDELNGRVIVADGYHRLCAIFTEDDEAEIPYKIA